MTHFQRRILCKQFAYRDPSSNRQIEIDDKFGTLKISLFSIDTTQP